MKRPAALLVAALVASSALAGVVIASRHLAGREEALPRQTREALEARVRAAAARPTPPAAGVPRRHVTLCVHGAATMAWTVADALHIEVLDPAGRLVPAALARLANLTLRAERRAERAAGGEALPQRMGRRGGRPIEPATVRCRGGVAYAAVPFD